MKRITRAACALVFAAVYVFAHAEERMTYAPTIESLKQHAAPEWYDDAKFGIFVHWTMSSVPAFASRTGTLLDVICEHPTEVAKYVPYAEWYWNASKFPDSPTAKYHREHYGDAPYESFQEPLEIRRIWGQVLHYYIFGWMLRGISGTD